MLIRVWLQYFAQFPKSMLSGSMILTLTHVDGHSDCMAFIRHLIIFNFMRKEILDSLTVINYWEGIPLFQLGFRMNSYLSRLEQRIGNRLIKVIAGQRRTGKSYIVRQLLDTLINRMPNHLVNCLFRVMRAGLNQSVHLRQKSCVRYIRKTALKECLLLKFFWT